MAEAAHRFAGDYWIRSEWREMPDTARRVRLALGPEPVVPRPHLMPTVTIPPPPKPLPPGPHPGTSLLADLAAPEPITREVLELALTDLDFGGGTLWGFQHGEWLPLSRERGLPRPSYQALTLAWDLLALPGGSLAELSSAGSQALAIAHTLAERLGVHVTRSDSPPEAARRAASLVLLKQRFARSVELRLLAPGTPFFSRPVWRAAYSLGFGWGHLDLLHWPAVPQRPLITLTSLGKPGYFLPERAAEGESLPGLALSFELPACPAPLETFDAMALALASLREQLGGRPTDSTGRELDSERLEAERTQIAAAVAQLEAAGIKTGSAEALIFF